MRPDVALLSFGLVFIGELPDKTMFASLVLATRGRPLEVWLGAAAAFALHVAIAVTAGVALFHVLPKRALDAIVAVMFLAGALYAWREAGPGEAEEPSARASRRGVGVTAFVVIFLAEWGDLTQILTANLAARYHSAASVAAGAVLALWAVAGVAVVSGQGLLRYVSVSTIRRVTAAALLVLAGYSLWSALR